MFSKVLKTGKNIRRRRSNTEKNVVGKWSEDEISIAEFLIQKSGKYPKIWHENTFGNEKPPSTFEGDSGRTPEEHVSLETQHEEDQNTEDSPSKESFSSQETLTHDNGFDNASFSPPPLGSFRDYILERGEALEKQLTTSDVNVNQNRLFLCKNHVEKSFLPLLKDGENIENGIKVCAYDIHNNRYNLTFKKWTNKYYVLNGGWKDFFQAHNLQKDDIVTVWIFRHSKNNKLCFALEYQKIER
ncbi:unnamed protein product [Sphenostylis stenocarpa]|uniref:TF-B3 domain-containing protein n=1 Tax=Sphenostylis stenocarpa TaxID=92480 RepID=A0AA86VRE4_9FABA|nr:unnamed protein product [Sphenostylis stenocarpa]